MIKIVIHDKKLIKNGIKMESLEWVKRGDDDKLKKTLELNVI